MIREKLTSIRYLPTEDEIRAACLQIRSGWSARERESRSVGRRLARKLLTIRPLLFNTDESSQPNSVSRQVDRQAQRSSPRA
jgi:hypothetical protein